MKNNFSPFVRPASEIACITRGNATVLKGFDPWYVTTGSTSNRMLGRILPANSVMGVMKWLRKRLLQWWLISTLGLSTCQEFCFAGNVLIPVVIPGAGLGIERCWQLRTFVMKVP